MTISPSRLVTMRSPPASRRDDALELRLAVDLRLALRLRRDARRRAADVERAQRELRARLADGLRGQDADRLAQVDRRHGRQVAAVAHAADAALRLARQHRADLDRLDAGVLDGVGRLLVDQLAASTSSSPSIGS
jgi:hypothetical protein